MTCQYLCHDPIFGFVLFCFLKSVCKIHRIDSPREKSAVIHSKLFIRVASKEDREEFYIFVFFLAFFLKVKIIWGKKIHTHQKLVFSVTEFVEIEAQLLVEIEASPASPLLPQPKSTLSSSKLTPLHIPPSLGHSPQTPHPLRYLPSNKRAGRSLGD